MIIIIIHENTFTHCSLWSLETLIHCLTSLDIFSSCRRHLYLMPYLHSVLHSNVICANFHPFENLLQWSKSRKNYDKQVQISTLWAHSIVTLAVCGLALSCCNKTLLCSETCLLHSTGQSLTSGYARSTYHSQSPKIYHLLLGSIYIYSVSSLYGAHCADKSAHHSWRMVQKDSAG